MESSFYSLIKRKKKIVWTLAEQMYWNYRGIIVAGEDRVIPLPYSIGWPNKHCRYAVQTTHKMDVQIWEYWHRVSFLVTSTSPKIHWMWLSAFAARPKPFWTNRRNQRKQCYFLCFCTQQSFARNYPIGLSLNYAWNDISFFAFQSLEKNCSETFGTMIK